MKFRALLLPLLVLCVFSSCKKEEKEKEYMDGSIVISGSIPKYVSPGEKYTFSASGVTAPDGTAVGYSFTDPITKYVDTTSTYTYVIRDSIGTFGITCTAYPVVSSDSYYVTVTTIPFTVVSESGSLGRLPISLYSRSARLYSRDYVTISHGGLEWICSNLSYIKRDASGKETFGHSFESCPSMQNIMGAFYTWEEAQTACPEGWHLPSDAEWVDLLKTLGAPAELAPMQDSPSGAGRLMCNTTFNGTTMWEYYRNVKITGDSYLGVLPAGYANVADGAYVFSGFGSYAAFWTSDQQDGRGVYRYINQEYDCVYAGHADKTTFAASVRCVR